MVAMHDNNRRQRDLDLIRRPDWALGNVMPLAGSRGLGVLLRQPDGIIQPTVYLCNAFELLSCGAGLLEYTDSLSYSSVDELMNEWWVD